MKTAWAQTTTGHDFVLSRENDVTDPQPLTREQREDRNFLRTAIVIDPVGVLARYEATCCAIEAESEGRREALMAKSAECVREWRRAENAEGELQSLRAEVVRTNRVLFDAQQVLKDASDWDAERAMLRAEIARLKAVAHHLAPEGPTT